MTAPFAGAAEATPTPETATAQGVTLLPGVYGAEGDSVERIGARGMNPAFETDTLAKLVLPDAVQPAHT